MNLCIYMCSAAHIEKLKSVNVFARKKMLTGHLLKLLYGVGRLLLSRCTKS